jgi:hypothetical protein
VAGDNDTHGGEGQRDGGSRHDGKDRQLMDETNERQGDTDQREHQGAEGRRGCR